MAFMMNAKDGYQTRSGKNFKTYLPVCALINDKILCMHGGISENCKSLDDIKKIKRPTDCPESGLLCDLLWADPSKTIEGFGENTERGHSVVFGKKALDNFLTKHKLDLVCRAHQVVEDGYEFFGDRRLVTIFSARNYCGEFDNSGALLAVDSQLLCSFKILEGKAAEKRRKDKEKKKKDKEGKSSKDDKKKKDKKDKKHSQ